MLFAHLRQQKGLILPHKRITATLYYEPWPLVFTIGGLSAEYDGLRRKDNGRRRRSYGTRVSCPRIRIVRATRSVSRIKRIGRIPSMARQIKLVMHHVKLVIGIDGLRRYYPLRINRRVSAIILSTRLTRSAQAKK